MPIAFGLVQIVPNRPTKKALKILSSQIGSSQSSQAPVNLETEMCFICGENVLKTSEQVLNKSSALMKCLRCTTSFHTVCLASHLLADSGHLLPVDGDCPKCETYLIWGDLVRFQRDNYKLPDCLVVNGVGDNGNNETDDDCEEFVEKDDDDEDEENFFENDD